MESKCKNLLKFSSALALSSGCFLPSVHAEENLASPIDKPNIVFFLIDDMGYMDVGFNGQKYFQTPNIDSLAAQGMIFTSGYANAPNCAPTRACLMSGQYPTTHGIYTVNSSARGNTKDRRLVPTTNTTVLRTEFYTMAEAMKSAGYVTGHFGKWHLGEGSSTGPQGQGFDVNKGGYDAGSPNSYFSPYNNPELSDGPNGEYLTDRLTDEVVEFIDDYQDTTFFIYFPHYAVHTPIQAKNDMIAKYDTILPTDLNPRSTKYAAMVESVDQSVGKVLDKLKALNLVENTLVVFMSDNGGHSSYTSMYPLRGHKGMLYEGGIREPMAVRWPAKVQAGSICDVPIIGTDFYPTFVEITGATLPEDYKLHGRNILPLLEQTGNFERDPLFWHAPHYLQRYSSDLERWRCTPSTAMRHGKWKVIEYFETGNIQLFNLEEDLGEQNDLAEFMPDTVQVLMKIMNEWRDSMNAPVPSTPNSGFVPLVRYDYVPNDNDILGANHGELFRSQVTGKCLSTDIEEMKIEIYHNAQLYFGDQQLINHSAGSKFGFDLNLEKSDQAYKIKMIFVRNIIDEVDIIVDNITVGDDLDERIEIDDNIIWLTLGDTTSVNTTIYPLTDTAKYDLSWNVYYDSVATVDEDGMITALSEGRTFVIVDGGEKGKDSCLIEVFEELAEIDEIILPNNISLVENDSIKIHPTILPPYAAKQDITWETDNGAVAMIDDGLIKSFNAGSANITGSIESLSISESINVDVIKDEYVLKFDGKDDYADCGSFDAIEGISEITMEAWVNMQGSGYLKVFNYGADPNRMFLQENNGKIHIRVGNDGTEANVKTNSKVLNIGEWTHIAAVFNGNLSATEYVKIYKNGVEQSLDMQGSNPGTTPVTDLKAYIGTLDGKEGMFQGYINELRIWNKALSEEQLNAMINQRIEEKNDSVIGSTDKQHIQDLTWSNLLGYYSMKPDSGDAIVYDKSNNKYDGENLGAEYTLKSDISQQIAITDIMLQNYVEIQEGLGYTLTPVIYPAKAVGNPLTWISHNTDIATISNGRVVGRAPGDTYISVYATNSGAGTYIPVRVTEKPDEPEVVENFASIGKVDIYPNPSSDFINIIIPELPDHGMDISIFNTVGQMVYQQNTHTSETTIDVSGFLHGVYYIKLTDKNSQYFEKIVVR